MENNISDDEMNKVNQCGMNITDILKQYNLNYSEAYASLIAAIMNIIISDAKDIKNLLKIKSLLKDFIYSLESTFKLNFK